MENLIIYHNPKFRKRWLVLGVAFFALGIIGLFFTKKEFFGSNMGICIVYLIGGLYTYYKPYVSIRNDKLWVSSAPFRKVPLNEIEKIKQFLDETTILSKGKETLISTQNMSEEDKEKFLIYIEELKENSEFSLVKKEVLT